MADFQSAFPQILKHEGNYNDVAGDKGGATNYGVSLRFLTGLPDIDHDGFLDGDLNHDGKVNIDDIKTMRLADAERLFEHSFWPKLYDYITSQEVATKLVDTAVNMGNRVAVKLLQKALGRCGEVPTVDGDFGPQTLAAINRVCANQTARPLMEAFREEQAAYYQAIVDRKPDQAKFLKGWLNRAAS